MRKLRLHELGRLSIDEYHEAAKLPVTVVLDNIRSAHNVGSIFRTVDGLGLEQVYLCGITPVPPHKEIHKTAIGATNAVSWEYHEDIAQLIVRLKESGHKIIGIEQTDESTSLAETIFVLEDELVIILGNEVDGISTSILPLLDSAVEIPQYGTKHSFNVAVCAGMALWEITKQLRTV